MLEVLKNTLCNTYNKKQNLVVSFILVTVTVTMYLMQKMGFSITGIDYYFIICFIMTLYYIYFIEEFAASEIEDKIVNIIYSYGYSRTQYIVVKIASSYLQGAIHGLMIWVWYRLVVLRIWNQFDCQIGWQCIIIYGFIAGILASVDIICALADKKRAMVVLMNVVMIIICPFILEVIVAAVGVGSIKNIVESSVFGLISKAGADLKLTLESIVINLLTGIILAIVVVRQNRKKNL